MGRIADVPARHFDELGVALRGPDGSHVADCPQHQPGDPQPQSETESGGHGAVDDRDGAWRTGEQDWFGEGAMDRRLKARDRPR
jgi:hypothetical protein